jgi:hypothetical protein
MSPSSDPATRATRTAANAAAIVVVLFAGLWFLTTQVRPIRDVSPFGEDPFDAVATYAAIILPFVAGATWIRSLSHRGPTLEPRTAARIRWGSAAAAVVVLASAAADLDAIMTTGWRSNAGPAAGLVTGLVGITLIAALGALRLVRRAGGGPAPAGSDATEPDIVDDGLSLATELAGLIRLDRPVRRLAATLERFLDGSSWSPRRHRIAFGIVLALACGVGFSLWHTIREGPPPDLVAPMVFTLLGGAGVLAAYFGTLVPLRLLRPAPE